MATYALSQNTINQLQAWRAAGVADHRVYSLIASDLKAQGQADRDTITWFETAAIINNPNSDDFMHHFPREYARNMLFMFDGGVPANFYDVFQAASNQLREDVLTDALLDGRVPDFAQLGPQDTQHAAEWLGGSNLVWPGYAEASRPWHDFEDVSYLDGLSWADRMKIWLVTVEAAADAVFHNADIVPINIEMEVFGRTISVVINTQSTTLEVDGRVVGRFAPGEKLPLDLSNLISPRRHCFPAGTPILTGDGQTKPIEAIAADDLVAAFDPDVAGGRNPLVPARVVRTFVTEDQELVEFHGVRVTPGHMFLTGEGDFERLDKILADDGTVVREDGAVVRARTNALVGTPEDQLIPVAWRRDGGVTEVAQVRAGVLYGSRVDADRPSTLLEKMRLYGFDLREDGLFANAEGDVRMAAWEWGSPPSSLCHASSVTFELARSA